MISSRYLIVLVLTILSSCLAGRLSSGEEASSLVTRSIDETAVVVFAKSYCPYCRATRDLLETMKDTFDFEPNILDLDLMQNGDGALIQQELLERTGQRTVPNVFIGRAHVGGNSDLQQLASEGKLHQMLKELVGLKATEL